MKGTNIAAVLASRHAPSPDQAPCYARLIRREPAWPSGPVKEHAKADSRDPDRPVSWQFAATAAFHMTLPALAGRPALLAELLRKGDIASELQGKTIAILAADGVEQ